MARRVPADHDGVKTTTMLQSYFRNVGILGFTEILLRLKALVLMPILTKAFGAVNYGIWAQVSVVTGMLTPLMVLGTDTAVLRFLPGRSNQEIRRGFSTLFVYYALISAGVAILLWAFSRPVASTFFERAANARFVVLCGGVIFAGLMANACRNFYRLKGSGKMYAFINIVQSLYSAAIALGVAVFRGTIFEVVLFGMVADLILIGILLSHIATRESLAWPDWTLLSQFVRFGLPLVPAGYAMWVLNLADRLFISYYGTLQDLGVYSLVYSLGYMLITLFFNPIWLMYPPVAAELYNQDRLADMSRLFRYSTRLALGLLVPAMVGVSVLGVPIIRTFSTEEFVRGAPLVPLITFGYTCLMMASYFDVVLALAGRQVWSTINIVIAAGVNTLLNFVLVPTWGIAGAAWTTALAFGIQLALCIRVASRYVRLDFDWVFFRKVCLSSLGMGAVLYIFPIKSPGDLVLGIVMGALVYALQLILLRALNPAEWHAILNAAGLQGIKQLDSVCFALGIERKDKR